MPESKCCCAARLRPPPLIRSWRFMGLSRESSPCQDLILEARNWVSVPALPPQSLPPPPTAAWTALGSDECVCPLGGGGGPQQRQAVGLLLLLAPLPHPPRESLTRDCPGAGRGAVALRGSTTDAPMPRTDSPSSHVSLCCGPRRVSRWSAVPLHPLPSCCPCQAVARASPVGCGTLVHLSAFSSSPLTLPVQAFLALVNVPFLAFSSMWAHCMPRTFLPAPTLPIHLLTGSQELSCLGQALWDRRRAWPAVSSATHSPGDGELLHPCCLWVLACLVGGGEVLVF